VSRILLILLAVAVALLLVFPRTIGEHSHQREMTAVKAISTIHTAETRYYSAYGKYATSLAQLGSRGADLIDHHLASGETGGFRFVIQPTPTGYELSVYPTAFGITGSRAYYSDQTMTIHQHTGAGTPTLADPLLGAAGKS
jgi:hypothetical protein